MAHRLLDLCLAVVVANIGSAPPFAGLPDELCQKIITTLKSSYKLNGSTLKLFSDCKLTKLDLKLGKKNPEQVVEQISDSWMRVTQGTMSTSLELLDVSDGNITDDGVGALNHLTSLAHLNLSQCPLITGSFLTQLQPLALHTLNLERCRSLDVPFALSHLTHFNALSSLNVAWCNVKDLHLHGIANLCKLAHLDLSNNPDITSQAFLILASLPELNELCISHCTQITQQFELISSLPRLQKLHATSCGLTDEALAFLEPLQTLNTLTLSYNKFTDMGMESLGKLRSLTSLDLSMCVELTDKGLLPLRTLEHMQKLHLNFCRNITDPAVVGLTHLTSLGIIGCDRLLIQVQHRPLVLLAEDNVMQSQIIKRVFERYHFNVHTASNGQMALDMYKSNPNFVLVVMDVMMPIMDGLTSTMLIRKYEWERGLKRTPIIMQTGDAREAHRQVCLEAGCDDFMTKPLDKRVVDRARELMKN
jgi:CheY-like chemotaxis protein